MDAGMYLAHKAPSETSFSVVQQFRREIATSGQRLKACHGGVLDPFAEGLLVLLVGPATRLMDQLHAVPKTYRATFEWGSETDNGDPGGLVVATGDPLHIDPEQLDRALKSFVGWKDQIPPTTSNKRVDGERAWKKAHRGEVFELPPSRVYLHSANWLSHQLPERSGAELVCGGGYYVRSLARDLGRAIGCRAHLSHLERSQIGPWLDPGNGGRSHIAGTEAFSWCPSRVLTDTERGDVRKHQPIDRGEIRPPEWTPPYPIGNLPIRALHQGRLVALLEARDDRLFPFVHLGRGF